LRDFENLKYQGSAKPLRTFFDGKRDCTLHHLEF
jgi:hypothetical protein